MLQRKGEWCELTVPEEWNGYSIESVMKHIWNAPKKLTHQIRMEKRITVNGEAYSWTKPLEVGMKLQAKFFVKEEYGVIPEYADIDILFEDDHLLVVNKRSGMDTHPNEKGQKGTLANAVAYHLQANGMETKVRHIHRLDKDTTGAVLFAKHALAGSIMDHLLEQRIIKRTYVALVHGKLKAKKGKIDKPIGRDRHHPTRRRVSPSGQKAITNYQVLKYDATKDITTVKLQLETGRTHQIRVHMSYIGHALVGDALYGGKSGLALRQALHAAAISLPHPITKDLIQCMAPFNDDPPIFNADILKEIT